MGLLLAGKVFSLAMVLVVFSLYQISLQADRHPLMGGRGASTSLTGWVEANFIFVWNVCCLHVTRVIERAGVVDESYKRFAMISKTVYEMWHEGFMAAPQLGVTD